MVKEIKQFFSCCRQPSSNFHEQLGALVSTGNFTVEVTTVHSEMFHLITVGYSMPPVIF